MALANVDTSRNQDAGRDVAGVSSTLTSLRANDVAASVNGLLDVLGVPDHVHDRDTGFVEFINSPLGRNANSGHEKAGFLLDNDLDELGELTFCVIVLSY